MVYKKNKIKMQTIRRYFFMKNKGSILAYSLIILTMMVAIVATMSISTMLEKKSASSTDFSVQAYATADSGIQLAIKKINGNIKDEKTIEQLFCPTGDGCECKDGKVTGLKDGGLDSYDISFFSDDVSVPLGCDIPALGENIKNIRALGRYKDAIRSIGVSVSLL